VDSISLNISKTTLLTFREPR